MNPCPSPRTGPYSGNPTGDHRLFCYGTLQIPAVLKAVIGRELRGRMAVLSGFDVRGIRGETYPGLARSPGGSAPGRLYETVSPRELAVLDRFEGRLYRRMACRVVTANGRRIRAWVYRMAPGREKLLTADSWHLDRFLRYGYPRFMQRFVSDRRTLYAPREEHARA